MTGGILKRVLTMVGGTCSPSYRALALNGNVLVRRTIAAQQDLDQKTLEILARRGPSDVRLMVAEHPSLTGETARQLNRIDDDSFLAAINRRFGMSVEKAQTAPELPGDPDPAAAPWPVSHSDVSALPGLRATKSGESATSGSQDLGLLKSSLELVTEAVEPQGMLVDPLESPRWEPMDGELPTDTVDLAAGQGGVPSLGEPWHGLSADDASGAISGTGEEICQPEIQLEPEIAEVTETPVGDGFEGAGDAEYQSFSILDELERGLDLMEGWGDGAWESVPTVHSTENYYDELAEIRFLEVFAKIPSGRAGEELLGKLATGRHAPKLHKLLELHLAGLNENEIAIAWAVRNHWNESHTPSRYETPLDYAAIGRLLRSYPSVPDVEEVLGDLETLEDKWRSRNGRQSSNLTDYIRYSIYAFESFVQSGGYAPFGLFLTERE